MAEDFRTVRDATLSLFQSAVAEVAERIDAKPSNGNPRSLQMSASATFNDTAAALAVREYNRGIGDVGGMPPEPVSRELSGIGVGQVCVELALRYVKALATGDAAALAQIEDEYQTGTCDVEWLTTLRAYANYFDASGVRKSIPYVRAGAVGAKIHEINANACIALVSDWGTGARPALDVLRSISDEEPDVLIHLGDVYYSGTPKECETNFVRPVNAELRARRQTLVYALAGNHDMYCGGTGFYDLIGRLNPEPHTQSASFFCLRSADEKWQLLAMDTGLHDDNPIAVADALTYLEEDELVWHRERVEEFGGKTILLSHHQPFSAFSPIGKKPGEGKRSAANPHLIEAFRRINTKNGIAAWFWGHEHSLGIYAPFAGINAGRCVGHGAVPVSLRDEIYSPVPDLHETPALVEGTQLGPHGKVFAHGYAVLRLQGENCIANYVEIGDRGPATTHSETLR